MNIANDKDLKISPTFSHFSLLRFTDYYWQSEPEIRSRCQKTLQESLADLSDCCHLYQVYPVHSKADILLWTALRMPDNKRLHGYFKSFAKIMNPLRKMLEIKDPLWGFTRPSTYSKTRSTQEIDPFHTNRKPYLVVYPFVKNDAWYALSRDVRQGMMNNHIRVGKEFPDITQLLLYSVGLQDQEFVVVYETTDLTRFSDLVNKLRSTEARSYTKRDTPLTTGLYHPEGNALGLFS